MILLRNAIQCLSCDQVIASKHRHDFQTCKCGKVSVDGGLDYKKRAFQNPTDYVECCAYGFGGDSKPGEFAGKFIVWSPGGKTNPTIAFDAKADAEWAAKELSARVPPSDWYVAPLVATPTKS